MRALLLALLISCSLIAPAQTVLFNENFEGTPAFALNTADQGGATASADNSWLINNAYTGGNGSVVCFGFPLPFNVGNTPAQPGGINNPNGNYLHITSVAAQNSGILSCCFLAADGLCANAASHFAGMTTDVATGAADITLSFWWLCAGGTNNYGEVYYSTNSGASWNVINTGEQAFISRYALGRDYHKVLRARLQRLADKMTVEAGSFNYRVFSDSAPVMEVAWAQKSGLGWRGKHTLLLSRQAGSMFFLRAMYVHLPLPIDDETGNYCGSCSKCIDICPTQAIVAPYQVDARRCISYLTIELKDSIPEALRPLIGNRIYGCDCLLYTSPSPRDRTRYRMPSSA